MKFVQCFDIWIYKETFWHVAVSIAFMFIMLDQESKLLVTLIVSGLVLFTTLLSWRTSFADFLELTNPYALSKAVSDKELELRH